MKIGILQAGHAPEAIITETGDYADLFQNFLSGENFEFSVYNVVDLEFPNSVYNADGWLITGSRHGTYDPLPFIEPLELLVKEIHEKLIPLVGICFGHQIIAQALGGKVEKFNGGWSVGHTKYEFCGQETTLNAWHQDQITAAPQDSEVIGTSPFCKYAFLQYGHHIFTTQAHPEFTATFVKGLINFRGPGIIPNTLLEDAQSKLTLSDDSDRVRQKIVNLFHSAALKA